MGVLITYRAGRTCCFRQFARDVTALPVHNYDLVISDYEPVSAWASNVPEYRVLV